MRPKKSFSAAIADVLHTRHHQRLLIKRCHASSCCRLLPSIFEGKARNIAALQSPARGLRRLLVETGKAGAIKRLVSLHHALGEGISAAEQVLRMDLRRA